MTLDYSEKGFEANIEESLFNSGYEKRTFDKANGEKISLKDKTLSTAKLSL